jgi:hypothetical protein
MIERGQALASIVGAGFFVALLFILWKGEFRIRVNIKPITRDEEPVQYWLWTLLVAVIAGVLLIVAFRRG